jgi:hypothetical protein
MGIGIGIGIGMGVGRRPLGAESGLGARAGVRSGLGLPVDAHPDAPYGTRRDERLGR